jgi:hypothetical protein
MKRTLTAATAAIVMALAAGSAGADTVYVANLTGGQEVPSIATAATGFATVTLNTAQTNIHVTLTVTNFTNTITASHFHKGMFGQNGGVQFNIGSFAGTIDADWAAPTAANIADLQANRLYLNVHSTVFPGGEIRGQVRLFGATTFGASLNQAQEVPPTGSAGAGYADLTLDNALNLHLELSATGLSGAVTGAHIHRGATGTNGPVIIDIGAFSGTTSADFVLTPTQRDELRGGLYYLNIHTGAFPGGEIRGQIGNASAADVADRATDLPSARISAVPNPARGGTVLRYETGRADAGEVDVFDATGRRLRTLVNGSIAAGQNDVVWDGRDESGAAVPSGTYYYMLRTGSLTESGRVTLIR